MSVDAFADWKAAAYGERDTSTWDSKYDVEKIKFTGFIAQEVEAAAEKIGYDFSGVDKPANDKSFYGFCDTLLLWCLSCRACRSSRR